MPTILRLAIVALLLFATTSQAAGELKPWSGASTPPLELTDLAGRSHRLGDYRGKVVLLNFWATWCVPCRDEMPSIGQLQQKLAGRPLVVLAVNVDEPDSRVRSFLSQLPLDFPVLLDAEGRITRAWRVSVLPASFLIAHDGRIQYSAIGELDWASERVVRLISEMLPSTR